MSKFIWNKNLLITQHKIVRVPPCLLKHGFIKAFSKILNAALVRLFPV